MQPQSIISEAVRILVTAKDSVQATVFKPAGDPRGVLVIHPATATPQRFYRALAEMATRSSMIAVTYDYRGTGLSGSPKEHSSLRMRDWIQQDIPAVARWAAESYPDLPHYAVGHSIGGHGLILDYGTEALSAAVIVASHVAASRTITPWQERARVTAILNVLGPVLSRAMGYMPGQKLGLGEDIPAAALLEWSRWIRKPNYFFDDPSMQARTRAARTRIPILAVGASDDLWATPRQMDQLTGHLVSAPVQRRTCTPDELGVPAIGHHGLMRRGVGDAAWPDMLQWLESRNC
ncbi:MULTISPECIES: alpha/beta hydrolase family protein [Glutamicibacter]|uniref:alpha/beta hydrolase family protein n=1 Tax=Glutamicibacter TaxID=1742989 RepID=UPI000939B583|nr:MULTISPECIES: alpha/beta hydrolase [Glutamicibacter]WIV43967.1 alpha/beta hydrolase [Glutamicibacter nicotianae]